MLGIVTVPVKPGPELSSSPSVRVALREKATGSEVVHCVGSSRPEVPALVMPRLASVLT
jgi:hypothetical protein